MHAPLTTFRPADGIAVDMVRAGEPRLRHYSRPAGDGLLTGVLARFRGALHAARSVRLPEGAQVATSR